GSGRRAGVEALVAGVEPAVLGATVFCDPYFLSVADAQAPDDVVALDPSEGVDMIARDQWGASPATDFRGPGRLFGEPAPVGPAGRAVDAAVGGGPPPVRPIGGRSAGDREQGNERAAHANPRRTARPGAYQSAPSTSPPARVIACLRVWVETLVRSRTRT